ncbi:MAG: hypothetical protein GF346_12650 [Candidatus Eisenbacteria bacterium]|nr:hypothetical protein [Candidatus Latescibacterota bacterium]MBD3303286.1 hypothetical protein [Candidatus Eisenbacteria bacterium]
METQRIGFSYRLRARTPGHRDRVVVVSEDPDFWLGLRREVGNQEVSWILAHSAREGLVSIEDPRVRVAVLDGALHDKPAHQLVRLVRQIRPKLAIVFASLDADEEREREAREVGVVHYGDRTRFDVLARVIQENLPKPGLPHPRRESLRAESLPGDGSESISPQGEI